MSTKTHKPTGGKVKPTLILGTKVWTTKFLLESLVSSVLISIRDLFINVSSSKSYKIHC